MDIVAGTGKRSLMADPYITGVVQHHLGGPAAVQSRLRATWFSTPFNEPVRADDERVPFTRKQIRKSPDY
jgi:hypothetical protein